ncbi:MAG TPA: hypothetical protein VMG55_21865 [Stellaceae bacterium]|jgi:hypothetical protein|nr:hypothetical protein [Stellaceae bacterium]
MAKVALIVLAVVAVLIAAGVGVLAVWDIPAPTQPIDRVLPDARFPR